MKLFEFEDDKLIAKLQALVDDPNTSPHFKRIAAAKLVQLKKNKEAKKANEKVPFRAPGNVTYALTSSGSTKKIKDFEKVFIAKDRKVLLFSEVVDAVKGVNSDFIEFDDGTTDDKRPSITFTVEDDGTDVSQIIQKSIKPTNFNMSSVDKVKDTIYKVYIG